MAASGGHPRGENARTVDAAQPAKTDGPPRRAVLIAERDQCGIDAGSEGYPSGADAGSLPDRHPITSASQADQ
jgi:hypothetical protein